MKICQSLFILLTLSLIMALPARGENGSFTLSEQSLKELAFKASPTVDKIEASYQKSVLEKLSIDDQLSPNLHSSAFYLNTKEKQLAQFMPVTSPIKQLSVGITKPTKYGMQVGIQSSFEQTTNSFVTEASTAKVGVSLSMDLHNDLFGRLTQAKLDNADLAVQTAKFQKEIGQKSFYQNLRKLYWALVANQEAQNVTKELQQTAKKQVRQAEKRKRSGVADSGEVSRYKSQLAARNASLTNLKYQRANLVQQLKELLPSIAAKEIKLAPYNVQRTVGEVLACTAMLKTKRETPVAFTYYDEVIELLNKQEQRDKKLTDSYGKWDLKLQSTFDKVGKDFATSDSFSDLQDNGETAYSVGLQLTIPLGSDKSKTRDVKKILDKKMYRYQIEENFGKIKAYHTQMVKSVTLLQDIVKSQTENTYHLSQSLKVSRRKFSQARISVEQLVSEQDSYFQSNLSEIQTKLSIINTLLDYFAVYTETPCTLNQI